MIAAKTRLNRRALVLGGGSLAVFLPLARRGFAEEADRVVFTGHETQGGLVLGRAPPGSQIWVEGNPVRVSDGTFCFGFGRDATKPMTVHAEYPSGKREVQSVKPKTRKFDIQRIEGLDEKYITPPKEVLDRIARDSHAVGVARSTSSRMTAFTEPFDWPANGPISSVYGSQRILNGKPMEPHYGVDVAAPEGAPVRAPVDGVVMLAEDLYLSGNTLILDHGHGVSTSYLHMSRLDVKSGDRVGRGDMLGAIGHTGRATGPHVCWRLNWFQTRLDVALVAGPPPVPDKT